MNKANHKLSKIIFFLSLFFSLNLAAESSKLTKIQDQPLPNLMPTREQAIANLNMAELLQRYHYLKLPLNAERSAIILDNYLKYLDGERFIFTSEDIAGIEQLRSNLHTYILVGDLNPAFTIYSFYMTRHEQYLKFMQTQLSKGIANIDFSSDERLELKRDKAPYPADKNELTKLWHMLFKNEVLRLKVAKKSDKEITDVLSKRFANQLRILKQTKNSDVFNLYMNSIASAYDPHTGYLQPTNMDSFNIHMSLSLSGIGAQLKSDNGYTKIAALIAGGPAMKSGQLKAADRIIGVAQKDQVMVDVIGWRLDDVVELIRGEKGTELTLEVIPASNILGDETSKKVTLIRDEIKLEDQAASSKIITRDNHKIGIIKIPSFYIDFNGYHAGKENYKSTTRDVKKILNNFKEQNVNAVVIDLRDNGGGSLQEANELTSLFIGANPTVLVRSQNGQIDTLYTDSKDGAFYQGPLTVIINRSSASASEIFAAAMQDYHRALIVGAQTFGKGTVQSIQNITSGSVKLTTAKFYRVSGQSTQNKGVTPDIVFPDAIDASKFSESALPQAIDWDSIKPAVKVLRNPLAPYLADLNERFQIRANDNLEFAYIRQTKNLNAELSLDTSVSLNEAVRRAEYKVIEQKRLELANLKRQAHNLSPLNNLQELEKEEELEIEQEYNNPSKIDLSKDAYLTEGLNITLDYLNLSNKLAAN